MDKLTVLQKYFGYDRFREGQEQLIDAVLSGRDVFGIMPTGGGKSLCYQIPAILLPGVTFVVSPLISLMRDQVLALKAAGIPAAYINSSLSNEQIRLVFSRIRLGSYKIVYIAPERLEAEGFLRLANEVPIVLIAVDEAHCISQWGQDFRPSYLKIKNFVQTFNHRPVIAAFTATATEEVRRDVIRILQLRDPLCLITGFDRPNLRYTVISGNRKDPKLLELVYARKGLSGIVYCATRKKVEHVCQYLCEHDISATRYHAGLSEEERRQNQEDFVYDKREIMVATNAFGMGIDKSNVRFVIHYNMPQSLEAYYQEAGRAGRDGDHADCILLYSPGDVSTARFLIEHGADNEELSAEDRMHVLDMNNRRLQIMIGYCKSKKCLRGFILDYFGQQHPKVCGNCSNCLSEFVNKDITADAQKILSCVKRIKSKLGYSVGAVLVDRTLRGSKDRRIIELGLDQLPTFGIMNDMPRARVREYIDALEQAGYLYTDPTHRAIDVTAKSNDILFHGKSFHTLVPLNDTAKLPFGTLQKETASDVEATLFDALRSLRKQIAERERSAAYMVFSDATLREMAKRRPDSEKAFLAVPGVGEFKLKKYGNAFLELISKYR